MRDRVNEFLNSRILGMAGEGFTVLSLLTMVAILIVTYWFARLVRRGVIKSFERANVRDREVVRLYGNLGAAVIWFLGLAALLHQSGMNPTAVFAAGGFAAVAIGFATQDLINNLVSGATLRLEGAIRSGDILEIGGKLVRVNKMRVRATIARDLNEQDFIIPNAELAKSTVVNYTLSDDLFRLRTTVGVHYGSDMARVREVLEATAESMPWRARSHESNVILVEFGSSSVDWEVSVWMDDPWRQRQRRSELNEAIWSALKEARIVIAFPQLDVHLDAPPPPAGSE